MELKDSDLFSRRDAELALLKKGQASRRYRLGDVWELNFDEIREAFNETPPQIVRCKDCKHGEPCKNGRGEDAVECFNIDVSLEVICRNPNWFCADGESKQ